MLLVETQYFQYDGELKLQSGARLGPITLAYETYGQLNQDRSNAILICHAWSGDAHVAGKHSLDDDKTGWWDDAVGPGKAFDSSKYFVVCSNVLGGCSGSTGPASINPKTGQPYALTFPIVTIADMVDAQCLLMDHLGIPQWLTVAGGSMGGMQALQWTVSYPQRVRSAIVLASTARLSPQTIALNEVPRQAIYADPNWNKGNYYGGARPDAGLAVARMIGHITFLSDESMRDKFGRRLRNEGRYGYSFDTDFEVESYLRYRGSSFTKRFDANSFLYLSKAMDYFDLSHGLSSLAEAFRNVTAQFLVVSYTSDWLYPSWQSKELVRALLRSGTDATYVEIDSNYGHDAFLLEVDRLRELTRDFLRRLSKRKSAKTEEKSSMVGNPIAGDLSRKSHKDGTAAIMAHNMNDRRLDLDAIVEIIPKRSSVLDLGCGDGSLLARLVAEKQVNARGVELNESNVRACIGRGLSVRQGNIEEGLDDYSDNTFDFVILSQTLAYLDQPRPVAREMLRVGKRAIISFDNIGYWRRRLELVRGTGSGNELCDGAPRARAISLQEFHGFAACLGARIEGAAYVTAHRRIRWQPALLSRVAVYTVIR